MLNFLILLVNLLFLYLGSCQRGSARYPSGSFGNLSNDEISSLIIPRDERCFKKTTCVQLNYSTCLGTKLPYQFSSLDLANDSSTQREVQEKLLLWKALQNVPKCWAVIQPLLCAVYMPKCENGMVSLPSQEMCRVTRGPCRIVEKENGWPDFLSCNKLENFPSQCKNDILGLKFNLTGRCEKPLVPTENDLSWYEGVEGCGIQCENPLFTKHEHHSMHVFIAIVGIVCLCFTFFTVLTFMIDWKNANKYPALIIFYINGCFMIGSIGWLAQFTPGAREDVVCRTDGTLRRSEPSSGENLSCIIVFILVYYFTMAGVIWFVMLSYSWHVSFNSLGGIVRNLRTDGKVAYFHMISWSIPLVMTIAIMGLGEVDGNSISGICFVGYVNPAMRAIFLLAPIGIFIICAGFFLTRGLFRLIYLKMSSSEIISDRANQKIQITIIRIGLSSFLAFVFVVTTFACHVYDYTHQDEWMDSFRDFVICEANVTAVRALAKNSTKPIKCEINSRPNLLVVQIHLLSLFGAGVVMSSWVWTKSTFDAWKRFFRRLFRQPINEPVKLRKHAMIAKAFAKRRQIMQDGRMSVTYHSTHDDPVGMNFDLNSAASQDMSSAFLQAIPKFVRRRGALWGQRSFGLKHGASNTDLSQRRFSLDSARRRSLDSQINFQINEQDWFGIPHRSHYHHHDKKKKRSHRLPWTDSRRGSDTSQASAMMMASASHWMGGIAGASHHRRGSAGSGISYQNHHKNNGGSVWSIANRRRASLESNLSIATLHRRGSGGSILYPAINHYDPGCNNLLPNATEDHVLNVSKACKADHQNNGANHNQTEKSQNSYSHPKEIKHQYQNPTFEASPEEHSPPKTQVYSSSDSSGFVTGENLSNLPGQIGAADETPVYFFGVNSKNNRDDAEMCFIKPMKVKRRRNSDKDDKKMQRLSAANLMDKRRETDPRTVPSQDIMVIDDFSDEDQ